jgi:hypothetical protein
MSCSPTDALKFEPTVQTDWQGLKNLTESLLEVAPSKGMVVNDRRYPVNEGTILSQN